MLRRLQVTKARALILLSAVLIALGVISYLYSDEVASLYRARTLSDIEPDCVPSTLPVVPTQPYTTDRTTIPNIIHYIWLLNGRDSISFDFKLFISVYSARLYLQPHIIFIHTDATPQQWDRAQQVGDDATRWTLRLPEVSYHQVSLINSTLACRKILDIKHASAFIIAQELLQWGGIYMDTDIVPLRDVKDLRESGFSNIMGIDNRGRISDNIMMCSPGSTLLNILQTELRRDTLNWETLLSSIAHRLQAIPGEVLILSAQAFSPSSRSKAEIKALFAPRDDTPTVHFGDPENYAGYKLRPEQLGGAQDAVDYWNARDWEGKEDWVVDFSGSYVVDAFSGGSNGYWAKKVTLDYILAMQSNYAQAVYPAVMHAAANGYMESNGN